MKIINSVTVFLSITSSVIGLGVINIGNVHNLHEAATISLPQVSTIFHHLHHSSTIAPNVNTQSDLNLLSIYKQIIAGYSPSTKTGLEAAGITNAHSLYEAATIPLPQVSAIFHHLRHSLTITSNVNVQPNVNFLEIYKQMLAGYPLPTKMMTGGTLAVCGDTIAQLYADEKYDKRRGLSFAAFDCTNRAVQHFAFPMIVQQCQGQYIGTLITAIPGMTLLVNNLGWNNPFYYYGAMEQTLSCQLGIIPLFYYPLFYAVTAFVQGLDQEAAVQRAKDTFIPLMSKNLLFWIPIQFFQFSYIDENLQIPFLSLAGFAWTFIISLLAGNAKQPAIPQEIHEDLSFQCVTTIQS